jgi:hypothetical protein
MERIEDVSRIHAASGIRILNCRLLTEDGGVGCNNCIIINWLRDNNKLVGLLDSNNKLDTRKVLDKLRIVRKEDESNCYVIYKHMYKEEMSEKIRVWKELK